MSEFVNVIHTAEPTPVQASAEAILAVDPVGGALTVRRP